MGSPCSVPHGLPCITGYVTVRRLPVHSSCSGILTQPQLTLTTSTPGNSMSSSSSSESCSVASAAWPLRWGFLRRVDRFRSEVSWSEALLSKFSVPSLSLPDSPSLCAPRLRRFFRRPVLDLRDPEGCLRLPPSDSSLLPSLSEPLVAPNRLVFDDQCRGGPSSPLWPEAPPPLRCRRLGLRMVMASSTSTQKSESFGSATSCRSSFNRPGSQRIRTELSSLASIWSSGKVHLSGRTLLLIFARDLCKLARTLSC
mmetsp:Transcript_4453/g.13313  ORF Transcript_4453/g.13313 Transcript_4453/m.13313 type:complete len:255 (-) Transcript_4453:3743-4507(-)